MASVSIFTLSSLRANTEDDVINGQTDLTLAGTYSGGLPTITSDVTFTNTAYTTAAFTIGSALSIGTLDDLSSTALTISGAGPLTLNGGTNSVAPNAADLIYVANSLTITNTPIVLTTATASGNFDIGAGTNGNATATFGGVISGTGFTKTGNGTLTLSGANTYTGGTALSAGTLMLGSSSVGTAGTVGSNGALTSGALGTGSLNLTGQFVGFDLNGQTFGNRFVNSANNNTIKNTSSSTAYITGAMDGGLNGGVISDFSVGSTGGNIIWTGQLSRTSNSFGITKTGSDTVIFSGTTANVGVGTVTVNAGTLGLGMTGTTAGTFGDSVTVAGGTLQFRPDLGTVSGGSTYGGQINSTITLNSGTVDLDGSSGQNSRVQQLIGTGGTITNTSATAATLGIAARDTNTTREFDGLIKDGTGTVALDFTNTGTAGSGRINYLTGANTYSGGTSIGFSTVRLGNNTALGSGLVTLQSNANATLDLNGYTFANGLANSITNATITNSSASTATVTSGFNQSGAGGFVISDFTVTGTGNINWSGAIDRTSGNGGFTKSGTNTLTLSGAGTGYAGLSYTVSGGTLAFNMPTGSTFTGYGNFNNSVSGIVVSSGASVTGVETTGVTNTIAAVISGAGTFTQSGAGTTVLTSANTFTGTTTVNSGGTLQLGNGGTTGTLAASSAITDNGTFAINRSNSAVQGTDFSTAAITGTGGLTQSGAGTTTLNVANTYTGPTVISAGRLQTSNTGSAIASSSGVSIASGASLDVNGNAAEVVNNLSGAGTITSSFSQQFSGVNLANNTNTTFSGAIDGGLGSGGTVTKSGTGILTLSGANTYAAATTVSAGTLLVNGSISGAGNVTVASGATLGGSGTIAGATTVNGTITGATNGTVGMLTLTSTSATVLGSSANYLVDLTSTTSDNLKLSGALTITSGSTLTFAFTSTGAAKYDLANYTSETGSFSVTNLPSGYMLSYNASELDLNLVTAVPEPSTWVAGIISLGVLALRLRKRVGKRLAA